MSNSYTSNLPRTINFKETNLREFVMGSSFVQRNKENHTTHNFPNQISKQLPFDMYNRTSLSLAACCPEDIQTLHANPIVFQEDLLPQRKANNHEVKSKTAVGFFAS